MYLIDTHVLVWAVGAPERLSTRARSAIEAGEVTLSVVSLWELVLKKSKAESPTTEPLVWWNRHVTRAGLETLPVRVPHMQQLDALPQLHRDPFDRLLIAQAMSEQLQIITADRTIARYMETVWA